MVFPAGVAGELGREGETAEPGGAVGDVARGEEGGESVLDGVVLAAVVGLPAEEAGRSGYAERADGLPDSHIEKVSRGIVVAGVTEVISGGGFEDAAKEDGRAEEGFGYELEVGGDVDVAGVVAGVFRGVGEYVARRVDGRIGPPEFHDGHPDRKRGALAPEGEVEAEEGVEGLVEAASEVSLEIVACEFD